MKLKLRKAKTARPVALKKKHHHHHDDDDDDDSTVPDGVGVSPSDESTQTSGERQSSPERWHKVQVKGDDESPPSSPQFPRSFSLNFPEEPFASIPETPVKKAPTSEEPACKEPVWKKRLRHQGKSPSTKDRKPGHVDEDRNSKEIFRKKDKGDSAKERGREVRDLKHITLGSKTVSFDEPAIKASRQTRKKQSLRRKQEKLLAAFDEEVSFDQLTRTNSGYSDVFLDLFEDEDFSLATPTIYTNATDESSAESSSSSGIENREEEQTVEEEEVSHRRLRKSSRSKSPREGYYEDDELDFASLGGCRSVEVLEELKMLTELFIPEQRCICAKPQEEISHRGRERHRGRNRGRKSRRSRFHA